MNLKKILILISLILFYGVHLCSGQANSTEELCKGWNTAPIVEIRKVPLVSKKLAGTITTIANQAIEDVTVIITDKNYKQVISFVKTKKWKILIQNFEKRGLLYLDLQARISTHSYAHQAETKR